MKRLLQQTSQLPRRAEFAAALAALVLLAAWWAGGQWYQERLLAERRAQVTAELTPYGSALATAINRRLALVDGLKASVQADRLDVPLDLRFEAFAAGLYTGSTGIRSFAVAPGGVLQYVYPLAGNEHLLGRNLLAEERPAVRADLQRAIQTRQTIVSGPTALPDGRPGIVVYDAVYLGSAFYGLVTLTLDLAPVLEEAGLQQPPAGLDLALRVSDLQVIAGLPAVFASGPATYRIELPDRVWEIGAVPTAGWGAAVSEQLMLFKAAGLTIAGLLAGLVYLAVNRQTRLEQAVVQRTRELATTARALERDIIVRQQAENQLREREAQYREIFQATSDGLVILDETGRIVEVNPAACAIHGYTRAEFLALAPGATVHPDHRPGFFERMVASPPVDTISTRSLALRKDGTPFYGEVRARAFTYLGRPHVLSLIRDVTEQVQAYQMLEQRVAERTRELSTLLDISQTLTLTLEIDTLVRLTLDQLASLVDASGAAVFLLDGADLTVLAYRGQIPEEALQRLQVQWAVAPGYREVLAQRHPIIVGEMWGDEPLAQAFQRDAGRPVKDLFSDMHAWMGVPLMAQDRLVGLLHLDHIRPNAFTAQHARLALAFASQVAVAIENVRLYREEQHRRAEADRRRQMAEGLREILAVVNSSQPLEDILERILAQTAPLLGTEVAALYRFDSHDGAIVMNVSRGLPPDIPPSIPINMKDGHPEPPAGKWAPREVTDFGALIAPELWGDFWDDPRRQAHLGWLRDNFRALLTVPLLVKDEYYGSIVLFYAEAREFSEEDLALAGALGDQAALAIENARLMAEIQDKAALEERQHLSRELHDSVSQALYGIALGARTARTLLDRDPSRVAQPLDYVLSLAEAGLAEMRALIFQLRPESLQNEGLVAAITKQAASLRARHGVGVTATLGEEPDVALAVKEGLYRIAQEAMNNTVKHARAKNVQVRLAHNDGIVLLEVRDDGVGFDPDGSFPGHLGLKSMRERAVRLGGKLTVESGPGGGASVQVQIPV